MDTQSDSSSLLDPTGTSEIANQAYPINLTRAFNSTTQADLNEELCGKVTQKCCALVATLYAHSRRLIKLSTNMFLKM